ncbi:MAG: hypothetical protein C6P35_03315 [Cohnella sp.]|uniref:hypothetical protein n=1 Tax=Cohnella sp. TaxID=1883426 RepID=UPI000E3AE944|nr:hypothetical protein [Cohnella sp.]REK68012.1 MAG: hypothetical protein C6P35_03315 [Cohnella sp.]
MKKISYIALGILIGVAMTVSMGAFAASKGMIGKKITAEVEIRLNGQKVKESGAVADGKTLLPVRPLADLFGASVEFKNGVVYLAKQENTTAPTEPSNQNGGDEVDENVEKIKMQIDNLKAAIQTREEFIKYLDDSQTDKKQILESQISDLKAQISNLESQLQSLESK